LAAPFTAHKSIYLINTLTNLRQFYCYWRL